MTKKLIENISEKEQNIHDSINTPDNEINEIGRVTPKNISVCIRKIECR